MRIICDLHIHGKYSRATSSNASLKEFNHYAIIKGLNLLGTGDFTHPKWFNEIKESLTEVDGTGLYRLKDFNESILFMITGEVNTVFDFEGKSKRIHHVICAPNIEIAEQVRERISKFGNLSSDGRPTLNVSAYELILEIMEISKDIMVFPAHAWTPWFSIFGANSGFDNFKDCYKEASKYIYALETGLSSDPPMNWRLSQLDNLTLVSNSDSHSAWVWRIGREANVFELEKITYKEIFNAIKFKDPKKFKFTIETYPEYGKYHWTGHRECNVSLSAIEAIKLNNICPKCGKKLTKGVEQRVEELANRPVGYRPSGSIDFVYLLPLSEIIATILEVPHISSPKVWKIYNDLINKFGNEYSVLLDASEEEIASIADKSIAKAIVKVRNNEVKIIPGYDGVYGRIEFLEKVSTHLKSDKEYKTLEDFIK
ncbi:MAG: endonuclease Q family protein [Candidatus Bathyarchaeia archaeon]